MTNIRSGLITLHVACQKIFGLWPTINSMSLLNLFGSNEIEMQCQPSVYEGAYRRPTWTFIICRLCTCCHWLCYIVLHWTITIFSFSLIAFQCRISWTFTHFYCFYQQCSWYFPHSALTPCYITRYPVSPYLSCRLTLYVFKGHFLIFSAAVVFASFMNNNNKIISDIYDSVKLYSSSLSHMLVSACESAFSASVNILICLSLLRFLKKLPLTCLCHRYR